MSRLYWYIAVLNMIFILLSIFCFVKAPQEFDSTPLEVFGGIAFAVAAFIMMVLGMISSYQQESKIRLIPIIGRVHKALVANPTQWGEALHINFMFLCCGFMVGFFLILVWS
jgi:hypothetical protein